MKGGREEGRKGGKGGREEGRKGKGMREQQRRDPPAVAPPAREGLARGAFYWAGSAAAPCLAAPCAFRVRLPLPKASHLLLARRARSGCLAAAPCPPVPALSCRADSPAVAPPLPPASTTSPSAASAPPATALCRFSRPRRRARRPGPPHRPLRDSPPAPAGLARLIVRRRARRPVPPHRPLRYSPPRPPACSASSSAALLAAAPAGLFRLIVRCATRRRSRRPVPPHRPLRYSPPRPPAAPASSSAALLTCRTGSFHHPRQPPAPVPGQGIPASSTTWAGNPT